MSLISGLRTGLFYLIYLGFATVALLEVIFRILPVSDSLKTQVVNDQHPIVHFKKIEKSPYRQALIFLIGCKRNRIILAI